MKTFSSTLDIDRVPEAVYGYVTDPLKFAEWQPDVVSVEWEGAGGRVGSRFVTRRRVPGGIRTVGVILIRRRSPVEFRGEAISTRPGRTPTAEWEMQ